ncbi:uncharacterized protein LOC114165048 isoform X2 [Vigna unguiculata]|uniref:uncharacterized protein LOC114165048 isoform X2 n=1 Tax=Vigna unguiculata TaxID=3917 RepID=UPI001016EBBD|nr:uncharacterized protein LOC114165048 isoform X2 [Vigna unguiculata]
MIRTNLQFNISLLCKIFFQVPFFCLSLQSPTPIPIHVCFGSVLQLRWTMAATTAFPPTLTPLPGKECISVLATTLVNKKMVGSSINYLSTLIAVAWSSTWLD